MATNALIRTAFTLSTVSFYTDMAITPISICTAKVACSPHTIKRCDAHLAVDCDHIGPPLRLCAMNSLALQSALSGTLVEENLMKSWVGKDFKLSA